jgi:hypothetical protein
VVLIDGTNRRRIRARSAVLLKVPLHVYDHRADLAHGSGKLLAADAQRLFPVLFLVALVDVVANAVRLTALRLVVGHGVLLALWFAD